MTETAYRVSLVFLLQSLAALDPWVGPVELCCAWFDDLYRPERQDGLTAQEYSAIASFNEAFAKEVERLPTEWPAWAEDTGWRRVQEAAEKALISLNSVPGRA